MSTNDAYMLALDAATGEVRWETRVTAEPGLGFENSSGPVIANGKAINGINGCTRLIRESCFITAHDLRTGRELWRTYTIARPGEPGGDTWGDLPLEPPRRWGRLEYRELRSRPRFGLFRRRPGQAVGLSKPGADHGGLGALHELDAGAGREYGRDRLVSPACTRRVARTWTREWSRFCSMSRAFQRF